MSVVPSRVTPSRPAPAAAAARGAATAAKWAPLAPSKPVPRMIFYGVEGWGKTTLGAFAPSPLILAARDEAGVQRLVDSGRMPGSVPVAQVQTWPELLATVDAVVADPGSIKTLVMDSLGSFERLCAEHICATKFNNEWGEHGFASYGKGWETCMSEWVLLLQRLDRLRAAGVMVIMLGHSTVATFKNPAGADFDRYTCDVNRKFTWPVLSRWADCVYFGTFETVVTGNKNDVNKKGKGVGGRTRVVHTHRCDSWDAKPGYAVPEVIDIPDDHTQTFAAVWSHIHQEKARD